MSLKNFNSLEKEIFVDILNNLHMDKYLGLVFEQYIYEEVIIYYKDSLLLEKKYITRYGVKEGKYEAWFHN